MAPATSSQGRGPHRPSEQCVVLNHMPTRREFLAHPARPRRSPCSPRRRRSRPSAVSAAPPTCCAAGASARRYLGHLARPDHAAYDRRRRRRRRARAARGGPRPRLSPRRRASRHPHDARGRPLAQGTRDGAGAAPPLLVPLRDARPAQPVGRFQTALPPDSGRRCASAFSPAPHTPTAITTRMSCSRARTSTSWISLGDYIYAETYRTVGGRQRGARRPGRQAEPPLRLDPARGLVRCASTAQSMRSTASDDRCASCTPPSPFVATWDDHEVQNNYANGAR